MRWWWVVALAGSVCFSLGARSNKGPNFTVDCGRVTGTLSPALDINQWDMERAEYLARIPVRSVRIWYSVCGPRAGGKSVFLGWEGVDDPSRYSFGHLDKVITDIKAHGAEPFLQIHASKFQVPKTGRERRLFARASANLIRHLNDGPEEWAPRHFGVKYVELWNEPDIKGYFDGGTKEDFNRLYEAWSVEMKAAEPGLKIGTAGYAVQTPTEWEDSLLAFVEKRTLPLDFLSWHLYDYGWKYGLINRTVGDMRRKLNDHGLARAASIITEYNYTPWQNKAVYLGVSCAAQNVSTLIDLEDTEVDICHRWTGNMNPHGHGLFHPETGRPLPAYWGYVALGKLSGLDRLDVRGGKGFKVLAGRGDGVIRLIVAGDRRNSTPSFSFLVKNLPFKRFRCRYYAVTETGLELVRDYPLKSGYFYDEIEAALPFVYLVELARTDG